MASTYDYMMARRNMRQQPVANYGTTSPNDEADATSQQTDDNVQVANAAAQSGGTLQPESTSLQSATDSASSVATTANTASSVATADDGTKQTGSPQGNDGKRTTTVESTTTWTPRKVVATPTTAQGNGVEPKKSLTYTEIFERLNPYKEQTPEEKERLRKKRKREDIISAIGDGLTSLANVYFTTQGAKEMNSPQLSAKSKERWDKIDAERKANELAYRQAMLRAAEMDKAADETKATAAREDAKWEWERQYKLAKAAADNDYKKEKAKADAEEKEKDRKLKIDLANRHEAAANRRASMRASGSGKGNNSKRSITLNNGKETVTVEYPTTKQGALRPFAQKIKQKAEQIVKDAGNNAYVGTPSGNVPKRYYQDIIEKIDEAKGSTQIMTVIEEYAADFPQLYNDFVKVIGESDDLPYARSSTAKPKKTAQKSKGRLSGVKI